MLWSNNENYVLSKTFQDNFEKSDTENGSCLINKEALSSIKTILRLSNANKKVAVRYFVLKYPKLIGLMSVLENGLSDFKKRPSFAKFINEIKSKHYANASKYAGRALNDLNDITKPLFYGKRAPRTDSYFVDDYNKIASSSSFRRLQDKAQIFSFEFYDFPRTRLTHSLEVSSVAEQITGKLDFNNYFQKNGSLKKDSKAMDNVKAVERCSGLLHDIGNPPFGHFGESVINSFFTQKGVIDSLNRLGNKIIKFSSTAYYKDLTSFDGNAQSLRIATKLLSFDNKKGSYLRAGVLGSLIKYPYSVETKASQLSQFKEALSKNKLGFFLSEKAIVKDLEKLGVVKVGKRNPLVYIMEAADDICYGISDIEDCVHKGLITFDTISSLEKSTNSICSNFYKDIKNTYDENVEAMDGLFTRKEIFEQSIKPHLEQLKSDIINSVPNILYNKKPFFEQAFDGLTGENSLLSCSDYNVLMEEFKTIKKNHVFASEDVDKGEIKGYAILTFLLKLYFEAICDSKLDRKKRKLKGSGANDFYNNKVLSTLSNNFVNVFYNEVEGKKNKNIILYYKMRLLIDHISGMTETYAERLYSEFNCLNK